MAAIATDRITADPATPAAIPILTNTPVPIIEPKPIKVAPKTPNSLLSEWDGVFCEFITTYAFNPLTIPQLNRYFSQGVLGIRSIWA